MVRTPVDLAISVHNDSKLLTAAAWSWPSPALANLHAEKHYKVYEQRDAEFSDFCPSRVQLHYRDPMHYAEMLHIEGEMERKKLFQELQQCLKFSVQIDDAVDSQQQDVFVRFYSLDSPLKIKLVFYQRENQHNEVQKVFSMFFCLPSLALAKILSRQNLLFSKLTENLRILYRPFIRIVSQTRAICGPRNIQCLVYLSSFRFSDRGYFLLCP